MQEAYLKRNGNLYSEGEIETIQQKLEALLDKLQMASFWLEQMWALSNAHRGQSFETGEEISLSPGQTFVLRCYLDAFLFEARAYVDFFMFYVLLILKPPQVDPQMHMKKAVFLKALERVEEPFKQKAQTIREAFQQHDDEWISFLKSLRDRIAHRDMLRASFNSIEEIGSLKSAPVRFNWPTINERTYERLCQDFENGIFELILDVAPVLFGIQWESGPYKPGMFGE